jgi:hypothetical protein
MAETDAFDGTFTEVINGNGHRRTIPTEWLGTPLGEGFTVAPSVSPSLDWTMDDLRAHADAQGIDLTGAGPSKAGVLARITGATTPPDTETPAGPGEE